MHRGIARPEARLRATRASNGWHSDITFEPVPSDYAVGPSISSGLIQLAIPCMPHRSSKCTLFLLVCLNNTFRHNLSTDFRLPTLVGGDTLVSQYLVCFQPDNRTSIPIVSWLWLSGLGKKAFTSNGSSALNIVYAAATKPTIDYLLRIKDFWKVSRPFTMPILS